MRLAETQPNTPALPDQDFALSWNKQLKSWRPLHTNDQVILNKGMWVPPDAYPEIVSFIEKYPIANKIFYYKRAFNQLILFGTPDVLPDLPDGLQWFSLKTYLVPSQGSGYKNAGSLWILRASKLDCSDGDIRNKQNSLISLLYTMHETKSYALMY